VKSRGPSTSGGPASVGTDHFEVRFEY
jgi:hypothetical protein